MVSLEPKACEVGKTLCSLCAYVVNFPTFLVFLEPHRNMVSLEPKACEVGKTLCPLCAYVVNFPTLLVFLEPHRNLELALKGPVN
jgi:hypothetical protein